MPQKALVCAAKGEGGEGVDVDAAYEALLKEIALQEFASGRYGSSERAFRREVDACGAQEAALREEIAATTAEIEEAAKQLEQDTAGATPAKPFFQGGVPQPQSPVVHPQN